MNMSAPYAWDPSAVGMHPHAYSSFICPQDVSRGEADNFSDCFTTTSAPTPHHMTASPEPQKKKRKSWGQVLPKPTTNLPPRKRAKTEEEKAQRKYERVQRNRHAAHMSRMRKQDEMENFKLENSRLKQENQGLCEENKRLRDELARYRNPHPTSQPMTPPPNHFDFEAAPSLTSSSPSEPSIEPDATTTPPPLDFVDFELAEFHEGQAGASDVNVDIPTPPQSEEQLEIDLADILNVDEIPPSDPATDSTWIITPTESPCLASGDGFDATSPISSESLSEEICPPSPGND
ncbi:MAG: hypothetical protein M1831_007374 [Alyxoria varia]|nr:MAG: hypothetical protein M1831_007374 [Alyxoria varia]